MQRRGFLATVGTARAGALAGCNGFQTRPAGQPAVLGSRPDRAGSGDAVDPVVVSP